MRALRVALGVAVAAAYVAAVPPPIANAGAGTGVGGRGAGVAPTVLDLAASLTHTWLVGLEAGASFPAAAGVRVLHRLTSSNEVVVAVDDPATARVLLQSAPGIKWLEADRQVSASSAPNDPLYKVQWNLQPTSATNLGTLNWEPAYPTDQGAGVLVAIVDSGFKAGGVDAPASIRTDLARNFLSGANPTDTTDDNGHGTFIADLIAGATNNGAGVAGIAPAASILPIKVLDRTGQGDLATVATGIDYAVSVGARVINLSLAGDQFSQGVCDAITAASRQAVVVIAAGNDSTAAAALPTAYPAACPGALATTSVDFDATRSPYADVGCVAAPGGNLQAFKAHLGVAPDGIVAETYVFDPSIASAGFHIIEEEGTSMSAAHVSGEAAVLLGAGADVATARRAIRSAGRPIGTGQAFAEVAADLAVSLAAVKAGAVAAPRAVGFRVTTAGGGVGVGADACAAGANVGQVTTPLAAPIVGVSASSTGRGYWLAASDGGIFSFGDAAFYGSTGAIRLNQPIVGIAATPSGHGYWLVASDGGIFSFGDAGFAGSTGAIRLRAPIVAMAAAGGSGYWLVAADGGIFSFGAPYFGSVGAEVLAHPIAGMAVTPSGRGYWLTASDGLVRAFGDAPAYKVASTPTGRVVGISRIPDPLA